MSTPQSPNAPADVAGPQALWSFADRDDAVAHALEESLKSPELGMAVSAVHGLCQVRPQAARDFMAKSGNRKRLFDWFKGHEPLNALMDKVAEAADRTQRVLKPEPWRFECVDEYGADEYDSRVPGAENLPILLSVLKGQVGAEAIGMGLDRVILAVGHTRHPDAVAPLLQLARGAPEPLMMAAFTALGDLGDCSTLPEIQALSRRHKDRLRVSCTYAVENLTKVQIDAEHVASALSDPARLARLGHKETALIDRLAQTGYREGVLCLETHLKAPDARVRAAAARALGRLRAGTACKRLLRLAADEQEALAVRCEAIRALGRTRDASAAEPLARLMTHESEDIRIAAVRAAGNLRRKRLLQVLGKLMQSSWLRFARPGNERLVEKAMTKIGDEHAIAALQPSLSSVDPNARRRALKVIEYIIGPHAVAALLEARRDPDPSVREQAVKSLPEQVTFRLV